MATLFPAFAQAADVVDAVLQQLTLVDAVEDSIFAVGLATLFPAFAQAADAVVVVAADAVVVVAADAVVVVMADAVHLTQAAVDLEAGFALVLAS